MRHLEDLRVNAERLGTELHVEELNLPHICADLGLAGLVVWRAAHDANHTAWQLDSRETLVWHRVARLWSSWASQDWMRWTGRAGHDDGAGPDAS
jgi:hypothetical protein